MGQSIISQESEKIVQRNDFSNLSSKRILITGASGLLGVYFVACLKEASRRGIPLMLTGVFKHPPSDLIKELMNFSGAEILLGDLTQTKFMETLPEADFIIHAAGYGQPVKFMEEPVKTLKLNTYSTFLLFDKLKDDGHFMFLSSSEVYAGLPNRKHTEAEIGTSNTTHPRACYIEGKRGGEAICNAYRQQGRKASSVRLSHTYGPGARSGDKRVLLAFMEKAIKGDIQMLDAGDAVRTYCYVADAVELMWKVLFSTKEPIYNVSGESKTSIRDLASQIAAEFQVKLKVPNVNHAVAGAPSEIELDTYLIENEFGAFNYTTIEQGISATAAWYKENLSVSQPSQ